ncbi:MAG TPA: energy transducer TonB [Myxococcota bacterium]|nr:energy transducer TonB [Myxococcota bacterium]
MSDRSRRKRREAWVARLVTWGAISLFLHVLVLGALGPLWPYISEPPQLESFQPDSLVFLEPFEEPDEEPEEPEYSGQIVEVAEPVDKEKPVDSDFLAEFDRTVPDQTRVEKFRVDRDVVSDVFSREDRIEAEELEDLNVTEDSTGAQVGNDHFDPDRNGALASLPSPFALTNKDGLQKPVPASHRTEFLAGSPSNDLLDVELGEAVALNTKEFLYASYINQIKQLVSFYYQQNLDNLPRGTVLSKSQYTTVVDVTLSSAGTLDGILISDESGSPPIDNCLVDAFKIAGPFPPPPDGLVDDDGRARLPHFSMTLQVTQAQAQYEGIDPRSGVQFPGILKAPR